MTQFGDMTNKNGALWDEIKSVSYYLMPFAFIIGMGLIEKYVVTSEDPLTKKERLKQQILEQSKEVSKSGETTYRLTEKDLKTLGVSTQKGPEPR